MINLKLGDRCITRGGDTVKVVGIKNWDITNYPISVQFITGVNTGAVISWSREGFFYHNHRGSKTDFARKLDSLDIDDCIMEILIS